MATAQVLRATQKASKFNLRNYLARNWLLYAMLVPGMAFLAVFSYYPMYGVVIAFQNFNPGLGFLKSPWVGWKNFEYLLSNPDFYNILRNSFVIAILKILADQICAIILALLLNEVRKMWFKRTLQTVVYLPHFLSWIVLGGILLDMLGANGLISKLFAAFQAEMPMFLGDNKWFVPTLVVTNLWKEVGWATIL